MTGKAGPETSAIGGDSAVASRQLGIPGHSGDRAPRFRSRRIAVLSPTLAGGGAERTVALIAAGLVERGHEVDFLLHRLVCDRPDQVLGRTRLFYLLDRGDGETLDFLDRLEVVPQSLFSERIPWWARVPHVALLCKARGKQLPLLMNSRTPRWAAGIAAYVEREHPSALLAMNVLAVTATTMAASLVRRPTRVVGTLHDVLRSGRLLQRARRSYPFVDSAVGISRRTTAELEGIPGMERARIHTIYNPVVSADLDRKARESPYHPWFDDRRCPVILAIGRMKTVKDFSTLLRAFARLLGRRPTRLIVLGEGRLRPRLRSLARELGIAGKVDFPGFKENPYAFLAKADLFVLSSRHEALPTVLIEAMACGCPVVSTDFPSGPREILEDGRLGPLVPVGDAEALAEAMARTLDDPPSPDLLRERASFFNVDRAVEQYEKLLLG